MTDHQRPNTPRQPTDMPPDESKRLNQQLKEMSQEQFQRQMRQAARLLSTGRGKAAIPLLERCHKLYPDNVDVLTNLGGAYILAARHRDAVPILERATDLAPANPAVWSNLAAAYLGKLVTATRARQENALAAYQRVVDLEPDYPNVHYNMGLIYVDRRDWHAANAAFTRAMQSNPHDRDAINMQRKVQEVIDRPADPSNN